MDTETKNFYIEKLIDDPIKENDADECVKFDSLSKTHEMAYAVGHFLNDLTATGWINYMLIYLSNINPISQTNASSYAGTVMLIGQITDGFTTPLVGYFSDKTNTRIGKRKPWYIIGTLIVIVSYIFIFENCLFSYAFPDVNQDKLKLFYYTLFGSFFNVGWAFVQVSHMSLVPSLTSSRIKRDRLNSYRNSFTYIANFLVLGLSLIFFTIIQSPINQFRLLSYFIIFLGALTSIFFIWEIDENHLMKECSKSMSSIKSFLIGKKNKDQNKKSKSDDDEDSDAQIIVTHEEPNGVVVIEEPEPIFEWYQWFKLKAFYQYGIAYIGVRITTNCLGALLNFYLVFVVKITTEDLKAKTPFQLALIPLLLYLFSVMGSLYLEKLYRRCGRKITYIIGSFLVCLSSTVMIFLTQSTCWVMYIFTCIFGIGQSLCLNTGIAFLSEVVGRKGSSGAFVFGFFSFWDKVLNGIILFLILNSSYMSDGENTSEFIRYVTCLIPMGGCIIAGIFILIGNVKDYKTNKTGILNIEDEFADNN